MSTNFFFHNQNNSTSSPGLLDNGTLTCSGLHFLRHFLIKHKILPNLVISNWLWWIMHVRFIQIFWMNNNKYYYSFKIFPQFWLAKSTRIIHHNQLLITKYGRILCLTRKWRQKCSLLQVNALLTEKTWGRGWVVLVVKTKMADISLVSRVRTRRNNS